MNNLVKSQDNVVGLTSQVGSNNVTVATQSAKALAEVQGKVFMAKQFPRDINVVMAKVEASCERRSLAEVAEFQYPRGNQMISGASIKLLEAVAQCYGNIHYTWKVLSRDTENKVSHCIAEAWDLENNISSTIEFDVSHYRDTKQGRKPLTDERDIYEMEANYAARRVRKCLENVVPRDIVDQAREWCDKTMTSNVDIQKELDKVINFFKEKYGITLKQMESYFGMGRQGFNKNTYVSLKKLYTSFIDGVANPEEVFPKEAPKSSIAEQSIMGGGVAEEAVISTPKTKAKDNSVIDQYNQSKAPQQTSMEDLFGK